MLSFIGDYSCKADGKGRVVVPASFRKVMQVSQQSVFVLRKNIFETCVDMYPYSEWEALMAGVRGKLNPFDRNHAAFLRGWYGGLWRLRWTETAGFCCRNVCWRRSGWIGSLCWPDRMRKLKSGANRLTGNLQ